MTETTLTDPVAKAARDMVDVMYRLSREWEDAESRADQHDPSGATRSAIAVALSQGYPFGKSLDEVVATADEWASHVAEVMANPPGPLRGVAQDLREEVARLTGRLRSDDADTAPDVVYRRDQRGAMGGEHGDFAALLGPGAATALADLLDAVEIGGDPRQAAEQVAARIREARLSPR